MPNYIPDARHRLSYATAQLTVEVIIMLIAFAAVMFAIRAHCLVPILSSLPGC